MNFPRPRKYGCELAGLHSGPPRLPLQPLTSVEKSKLEQVIHTLKAKIFKILVDN